LTIACTRLARPVVALAVIAHVEHLSRRLGRAAVVCAIIAAVAMADCWAVALLLAAASFALVAIRKERQMEVFLCLGKPGISAVEDYDSTIHASFLTMGTAALGFLLVGLSKLILVGGGGPAYRLGWIVAAIGSALYTVALISHFEHLSRWMGLPAFALGIFGSALYPVMCIVSAANANGEVHVLGTAAWLLWGALTFVCGITLGWLAFCRRGQVDA